MVTHARGANLAFEPLFARENRRLFESRTCQKASGVPLVVRLGCVQAIMAQVRGFNGGFSQGSPSSTRTNRDLHLQRAQSNS